LGPISNSEIRRYGLLALPLAVTGLPLYLHAPDYYVTERGISLSLIGAVLLMARLIDAFQDPLIGALSDRFSSMRRSLMLSGVAGLAIGMLALFIPPQSAGIIWFTFWVIVATSCYSLVTINLNAIGGIWSDSHFQRTRISSTRERFALLGVSLGVLIPGLLAPVYGKAVAFSVLAFGLAGILAWSAWLFNRWARNKPSLFDRISKEKITWNSLGLPTDKRVRSLVAITLVGSLASSLPAVLFLFFVRDRLQAEEWAWLFLLIYFISALLGIPFWRDASKRWGKIRTWCVSIAIACLSFIGAIFVGEGDLILYGVVCLATGFALGGDLIFPASLMADYFGDSSEHKSKAGSGYAWLSFIQKAALGLAAGIAFTMLGALGFSSGSDNSNRALLGLLVLYAVVPLVLKLTGAFMLWGWRNYLEDEENNEKERTTNSDRALTDRPDSQWMHKPYEN